MRRQVTFLTFRLAILAFSGFAWSGCKQENRFNPIASEAPQRDVTFPQEQKNQGPTVVEIDPEPKSAASLGETTLSPLPVQEPIATLEVNYFRTEDAGSRSETLRAIAERNNSESAKALHRIFLRERHRSLKVELLAQLGDMAMGADLAPKIELLSTALRSEQPRDVRLAALGVLVAIDDFRVPGWLRQLAQDSDLTVRQSAAAYAADFEE